MRGFVWLGIAVLLIFAWIGSYVMYHVAGFLIHLLLIFALISLVIHVFSGGRRCAGGSSPGFVRRQHWLRSRTFDHCFYRRSYSSFAFSFFSSARFEGVY